MKFRNDIPTELRRKAIEVARTIHDNGDPWTEIIASTIMEERERCSIIARTFEDWGDHSGYLETASVQIAKRIKGDVAE